MPHVDPVHLGELALGNDDSPNDLRALRHIARCARCREELSQMVRVVVAARGVEEPDLPTPPPDRVWQTIARELAETAEPCASWSATGPGDLGGSPTGAPRPLRFSDTRRRGSRRALGLLTALVTALLVVYWWREARVRAEGRAGAGQASARRGS
ncbi:hypothetical protein ABZZ46_14635 [Streptomyces rochei]|uniref:hypothetical protein n=1 Tax=Streptomyces rochei TaxID=1928 RepID=UPI0033A8E190